MTKVPLHPWKHGLAIATVCGLIVLAGCAADFDKLLLRPTTDSVSAKKLAEPEPSSQAISKSAQPTPLASTTQVSQLPAASPASTSVNSQAAIASHQSSRRPPANWSEVEQMLATAGSNLTAEQQNYLRNQMLAVLSGNAPREFSAPDQPSSGQGVASLANTNTLPGPQPEATRLEVVDRAPALESPVPIAHRISPPSSTDTSLAPPVIQSAYVARIGPAPAAASSQPAERTPAAEVSRVETPATQTPVQPASPAQPPSSTQAVVAKPEDAPAIEKVEDIRTGQWRSSLTRTIDELDKELARFPHDDRETASLTTALRLLHVIANHPDEATKAIEKLPAEEQEFWTHQLHALLLALDADNKHVSSRRAALVLRELRSAVDDLANVSTLDVRNMAFCEAVESYGRYTEFRSQSFRPGAEVLLYVEIENFMAEPVGDKFETELQATYDIFDSAGIRVANVMLPLDKQLCDNRRRDYFVAYHLFLPKELQGGTYTLRLTIEDLKGHKSSQGSIDFRIR